LDLCPTKKKRGLPKCGLKITFKYIEKNLPILKRKAYLLYLFLVYHASFNFFIEKS